MLPVVSGPKTRYQFTFRLTPRERSGRFELLEALAKHVEQAAGPGDLSEPSRGKPAIRLSLVWWQIHRAEGRRKEQTDEN
jgi:hypothetical protein